MRRIALDTNVLLAAFVARGLCAELVALLIRLQLDAQIQVMISQPVLTELTRHLKGKFKANAEQIRSALDALEPFEKPSAAWYRAAARLVSEHDLSSAPDEDDVPVLRAALLWQADLFVTGDKALWPLSPLHGMRICAPREAFVLLHSMA